jgi:hypothetical protein
MHVLVNVSVYVTPARQYIHRSIGTTPRWPIVNLCTRDTYTYNASTHLVSAMGCVTVAAEID